MRNFRKVTPDQAKRVMDIYNHCDRFYHEHVIRSVLKALDVDFYYDIYKQQIVLEVDGDAE